MIDVPDITGENRVVGVISSKATHWTRNFLEGIQSAELYNTLNNSGSESIFMIMGIVVYHNIIEGTE